MNQIEFSKIRNRLKQYLALLKQYQDQGNVNVNMTFDKGYWLSENSDLNVYERYFLQEVGDGHDLISFLQSNTLSKDARIDAMCFLGWATNKKDAGNILEEYMMQPSIPVAAAAARALFPLVASVQYIPQKESVVHLLHRKSKFAKNKALGLLAFLPSDVLIAWMDKALTVEIQSLSKHKDVFIVGNIAALVAGRLK
jgi:hypothetical protein